MFDFYNYNKGTRYLEAKNYVKAVQFLKRELALNEFKECHLNLGNAYKALGDFPSAGKCYLRASSEDVPFANGSFGDYDLAWSNYGLWKYAMGDDDGAIELYRKALDKNPKLMDAIWNYSSAILRKLCSREDVDSASAWKMYDFRFKRNNPVAVENSVPVWDGISRVSSIVVLAEQGFGDKIMFGRYIHCLEEYCDEVIVQCPPHLDLIYDKWRTCRVAAVSGATASIPICSLAARFGDVDGEWLKDKFVAREFAFDKLNVGVEWAGSITHTNDRNRSVSASRFAHLNVEGVQMYSFRDKLVPKGIIGLGTNEDWAKTAEALSGLDLLITVDTSVAHMAGSMGVKTWLLQPSVETDFRWGNDSMREDNIWYPSVKIIRNPGSWDKVFRVVKEKLVAAVKEKNV